MKRYKILMLVISIFATTFCCSGSINTQRKNLNSLRYYESAYGYIKESQELQRYCEEYQIHDPKNNLCISQSLLIPIRDYFINEYTNYMFQLNSDSIKRQKKDSLLIYESRYFGKKNDSINYQVGKIAKNENCQVEIFFREFRENFLSADVYVVQKYEKDYNKFDPQINTNLSYFFIFENGKIAKVFVKEFSN